MHCRLMCTAVCRRLAVICVPSPSLSASVHRVHSISGPPNLQPTSQTSTSQSNVVCSCIASLMDSSSTAPGTSQPRGMPESKRRVLDQSWTIAAQLYLQELAPRFTPWLSDAVRALLDAQPSLPRGLPVLVPCCGPGHELPVLHRYLQGRHPVIGSDLAEGMVQLAQSVIEMELKGQLTPHCTQGLPSAHSVLSAEKIQHGSTAVQPGRFNFKLVQAAVSTVLGLVASQLQAEQLAYARTASQGVDQNMDSTSIRAEQLDACMLDQHHSGSAAAVISVFGLQQLGPLAPQALASWVRCLAPGGVAIVVLWPSQTESPGGPWAAYAQALEEQLAASSASQVQPRPSSQPGSTSNSGQQQPWEETLTSLAVQVPGCSLVADTMINHEMVWDSPDSFWQVMTQGGPWHARRLVSGNAFMDQLQQRWLKLLDLPSLQAQYKQLQRAADDRQAACIPFLEQGDQQAHACEQAIAHHPCARMIIIHRHKQDAHQPNARQEARL